MTLQKQAAKPNARSRYDTIQENTVDCSGWFFPGLAGRYFRCRNRQRTLVHGVRDGSRAKDLSNFYSCYAKKGGAMGGVDKRIVEVFFGKEALRRRSVILNLDDGAFGTEDKDEWLILSYIEPELPAAASVQPELPVADIPMPPDSWFDLMASRSFESEREVEYYFIVPLLEHLGYEEDDFAIGYPVQMYEGVKKVNKEADFVLFNGLSRSKDDALLIVEAKRMEKILTEDAIGQARGYAIWLSTPYYVVTNGNEVRVYLFRGAIQPDVMLMTFKRSELRQQWAALYQTLNKRAVIDFKEKLSRVLTTNGV